MNRSGKTVKKSLVFEGLGIHSGKKSVVRVLPRRERGILFCRNGVEIPATWDFVSDTRRCTTLEKGGQRISTVEHLLAVCFALGLDSLRVEVDGGEIPILDGSSKEIGELFMDSGVEETGEERKVIQIKEFFEVCTGDSFAMGIPAESFSLSCRVDYNNAHVGVQSFHYDLLGSDFMGEIAPARTFGFYEEIKSLLDAQLAKGGSLDNALIIKEDGYMNPPRFPDEVVRHKVLDILGDLALAGGDIKGHIVAVKPSHSLNWRLVKQLSYIKS